MSPERDLPQLSTRTLAERVRELLVATLLPGLALAAVAILGHPEVTRSLLVVTVCLSAVYGGLGPGLLSAVVCATGVALLTPPGGRDAWLRLAAFAAMVVVSAIAAGALRVQFRRAVLRRERAERRARKLAESQAFTQHLATARELGDVDRAILETGLPALGAAGAVVARVGRGELEVVDVIGPATDVLLRGVRIGLDASSPLSDAVRTREPVWIETAAEVARRHPSFAAALAPLGEGALAVIPMATSGVCTGAIALAFSSDRAFGEEERSSIVSLVTTAGRVFERARLLEDVASERARAELLASMAADLGRGIDLESVIRTALVGAARLLGGDDGAVYLFEPDGKHLCAIAEVRPEQRTGGVSELDRLPGARRVLDGARARFFERSSATGTDAEWFDRYELMGSIVAPLLQGERRLGVLYVHYLGLRAPHPDEVVFADAIAAQCSLAISRAQAFEKERLASVRADASRIEALDAAERVSRLQEITAALSSAMTMNDVASVIFDRAIGHLGANAAGIVWMVRPGTFELVFGRNVTEEEFRTLDEAARRGERLPIADAIVGRRPIFLESPEQIRERYPVLEPLRRSRGESALVVVPLVIGSTTAGVIGFTFELPRVIEAWERRFVEAVGQLGAQAFERARLFEAERAERARATAAEEEAKQTARVQEQLMGVVGHDLRTPLSAIMVGAGLMARRGGLRPDQERTLGRIYQSAHRANHIIRDLLDYSRRRSGLALPIQKQPIRVADVCERAVLEHRTIRRDVELSLAQHGDSALEADPARIAQVVSNLIGNAIQHGRGAPVEVSVQGRPDEVLLLVRNRGPPIRAEVLPRIFEPFQRDPSDTAGARAGSVGLGLYIVREIVAAHDGRIEVASTAEEGTTFTVRLPRTASASAVESPGRAASS